MPDPTTRQDSAPGWRSGRHHVALVWAMVASSGLCSVLLCFAVVRELDAVAAVLLLLLFAVAGWATAAGSGRGSECRFESPWLRSRTLLGPNAVDVTDLVDVRATSRTTDDGQVWLLALTDSTTSWLAALPDRRFGTPAWLRQCTPIIESRVRSGQCALSTSAAALIGLPRELATLLPELPRGTTATPYPGAATALVLCAAASALGFGVGWALN